jgi:DNA-binding NtrC family response regulator
VTYEIVNNDAGVVVKLPDAIITIQPASRSDEPHANSLIGKTLAEIERFSIEATLRSVGRLQPVAADILGLSERTIYRKLVEYGHEKREGVE